MNTPTKVFTYRDLIVWQKAMQLVTSIYKITSNFPKEEQYGLTSQMRRAAVSIASNIAEGRSRGTTKDYLYFLRNAQGSGTELETQLEIAERLGMAKQDQCIASKALLNEILKMLYVIIKKLNPTKEKPPSEAFAASEATSYRQACP